MIKPFESAYYSVEIITPVHIGGAKENDYLLGVDFYYDELQRSLIFFNQDLAVKNLTPRDISRYTTALTKFQVEEAADIMREKCRQFPRLISKSVKFPFDPPTEIKCHFVTGFGKPIIPGSSVKGCIRSTIGNFMINNGARRPLNNRDFDTLFGAINNNLMRFLQVSDIELDRDFSFYPMKIFSGDIESGFTNENGRLVYEGYGSWKNKPRGGHGKNFEEKGFVFVYETCTPGAQGILRLNWAEGLGRMVSTIRKPEWYTYYEAIKQNGWMAKARSQMASYLERERAFYKKFYNNDFADASYLLDILRAHNEDKNAVIFRMGGGSGYHAITGNWRYADHTQTEQASTWEHGVARAIDAIKYKTRKVAFGVTEDEEGEIYDFQLPGFIKLTLQN